MAGGVCILAGLRVPGIDALFLEDGTPLLVRLLITSLYFGVCGALHGSILRDVQACYRREELVELVAPKSRGRVWPERRMICESEGIVATSARRRFVTLLQDCLGLYRREDIAKALGFGAGLLLVSSRL